MRLYTSSGRASHPRRKGVSARSLFWAVPLLGVVAATGWSFLPGFSHSSEEEGPMMYRVGRSDFLHEITERGNVESATNKEVRCEVQSLGTAGTRIIWIIPEGSTVKKGQEMVRLDSSSLENDKTKQQIQQSNSKAAEIQASNDVKTAKIAEIEYLQGKFVQDEQTAESEEFVAREDLRRAEEYLNFSKKLEAKGYITKMQREADEFALEKAKRTLAAAGKKKEVLCKYTKDKQALQLKSDIDSAKAKLEAAEHTLKLDTDKLKLIEDQIKKCTITAPEDGQVVYANQNERWGGQDVIIEEGALIRERQVIIRLPNPDNMQVKAKVNESKVALVAKGQTATIRVQAYPDMELKGEVTSVSEYPAPGAWYASNIKEYDVIVAIHDSPVQLRPGLTAEVKIRVASQPNVLQVPVQAIFEHCGDHYCVVRNRAAWEARHVEIGLTNDKFVMIREGLEEGEMVAMNAPAYREELNLPEAPQTPQSLGMETAEAGKAPPKPLGEAKPGGPKGAGERGIEGAGEKGRKGERKDRDGEREKGKPGEVKPAEAKPGEGKKPPPPVPK